MLLTARLPEKTLLAGRVVVGDSAGEGVGQPPLKGGGCTPPAGFRRQCRQQGAIFAARYSAAAVSNLLDLQQ